LLLKNGSVKPYEKEYIQKNGNRITALKGAALLDRKNKTSVVFALDISKRSEREKRKDEFLSIASHEMKTPITSIKGFAQLLMRRFEKNGDEKTASYLTRMVNQINRLTYLVNDILDMRKIQDNKLVLNNDFIDINQLVEDAVKEVHLSSPAHAIEWKRHPSGHGICGLPPHLPGAPQYPRQRGEILARYGNHYVEVVTTRNR
jgi:signal transduction histidine kinase